MHLVQKLVVFYQSEEINIKDIDREIYTDDKKIFHMFFFSNVDLGIDKLYIQKRCILQEFEKIEPEIKYDEELKIITMTKKLENFDSEKLDQFVDEAYSRFVNNINYRTSCILDTYKLFNKLYKEKAVIFLIPFQIFNKFIKMLEESKSKYQECANIENTLKYYDINYWASYFSRAFNENDKRINIAKENIIKILEILE